jgi:hypothetical protein
MTLPMASFTKDISDQNMGEYIERGYHAMALNEERKDFVSLRMMTSNTI